MSGHDYIRDGAAIYARSFAIIRAESDLARFSKLEERVAVRIIHACGMVEIARDIVMSATFAGDASTALKNGAAILCDATMVARGVTRSRLPASNDVICTLDDARVVADRNELHLITGDLMMRTVGDDEPAGDDALPGIIGEITNRAIRVPCDTGELIERMTTHSEPEQLHFITETL